MAHRRMVKFAMGMGAAALVSASLLLGQPRANAASQPEFLMTWKALNSYAPSFYSGKVLPSYGSKIVAAVSLVQRGQTLDLSNQIIYWYLNDVQIGGGTGAQEVSFPPFGIPPDSLALKVVIPNYNGAYLSHEIDIPYVNPEVVIYAPYPNQAFTGNMVTLTALPFFFNASPSTLGFTWTVNGQTAGGAENPQSAQIGIPAGTPAGSQLSVLLHVNNPIGGITADAQSTLTYNGQL